MRNMAKRKGLSVDEKRERILGIFHEKREVFQLREVEQIASKEKGVVLQTVKGIVEELVDDGQVDSDKIGTSKYYWMFPGKVSQQRMSCLADLKEKMRKLHTAQAETVLNIEQKQAVAAQEGDSSNLVSELENLRERNRALDERFRKLADSDPDVVIKIKQEIQDFKSAINEWNHNLRCLRTWLKEKHGKTEQDVNETLNIPQELDDYD